MNTKYAIPFLFFFLSAVFGLLSVYTGKDAAIIISALYFAAAFIVAEIRKGRE